MVLCREAGKTILQGSGKMFTDPEGEAVNAKVGKAVTREGGNSGRG